MALVGAVLSDGKILDVRQGHRGIPMQSLVLSVGVMVRHTPSGSGWKTPVSCRDGTGSFFTVSATTPPAPRATIIIAMAVKFRLLFMNASPTIDSASLPYTP